MHAAPRAPVWSRHDQRAAARLPPYTAQRTAMGRTANSAFVRKLAGKHEPAENERGAGDVG